MSTPKLTDEQRQTIGGNYVIDYRSTEDGIEVYRVLHAARQCEDHL